ncbi:MAG: PspC domain-containing protein [Bacteroidaceae bacterium]|nr:PspC domain-containing protein [Bacteroidaceae bacterium]
MEEKRTLYRDTDNRILGGVASGLASYMDWDVTLVRLAMVFCLFTVQGSLLAYIIAWIIIPSKYNPSGGLSFGKILLLIILCALPVICLTALFGFVFFTAFLPFL